MNKVIWCKLETQNPALRIRRWWPLYFPAHRDPDIGSVAADLHHHIAWNRVNAVTRRLVSKIADCYIPQRLGGIAVLLENSQHPGHDITRILEQAPERPTPIITASVAPQRNYFPEADQYQGASTK